MLSDLVFPQSPPIVAEWQPIFLEPIVNSGERIAILILIKGSDGNISIHKTVNDAVLKSLYSKKYTHLNGLIEYLEKVIKQSPNWEVPFEGIYQGIWNQAADFSMEGILDQALSLTSSLSTHTSDLEDSTKPNVRNSNIWFDAVKKLVIESNPRLNGNFDCQIIIAKNISYTYSFSYKSFVANLLDFKNINNQKAQTSILQMQLLAKNTLIKDKKLILQMPSRAELDVMTTQKKDNLYEKIEIFTDLLSNNDVDLTKVDTAEQASQKLLAIAI